MAIFAISDLHLGIGINRTMDIFGERWVNHVEKINTNWRSIISQKDIVIISGDISWAMRHNEALADLEFIDDLPGKKLLHKGNHDFWWDSTDKLNSMFKSMFFLKNDFYPYGDFAICASRGWICPNDNSFSSHDEKIYRRELLRVKMSFDKARKNGYNKFILSLHFPPRNDKNELSGFMEIIDIYKPKHVIYGHLHGEEFFDSCICGHIDGVNYSLVSADCLNFRPLKIFDSIDF